MIINNLLLFMSILKFILININIMGMRRNTLTFFFISILVGKERGEIIIRIRNNY